VRTTVECARMTVPVQPWEGQMPMIRAVASVAWLALGLSAGHAQTPTTPAPRLPPCSQSMIVGTWQAVFSQFGAIALHENLGFACPIVIATNGTLTPGSCLVSAHQSLIKPPTGTLTIDRACHVVGSIAYTFENATGVTLPVQLSVSLWRSADGSRLTGNVTVSPTCGSSPCVNNYVSPFELVAAQ
jgi:hypothetical protein